MHALEIAVAPLDAARRATLRLVTRSPSLTRILARRDSRIACLATFQVLFLFAVALRAPVVLFFLGPVFLGVAHLAADVRYLVLRRAPPRSLIASSIVIAAAITIVRVAVALRHLTIPRGDLIDVALGVAWIGFALAVALRDRARLALLLVPLFAALAALLLMHARLVEIVLIHLHNVVALVAWLVLFRPRARWLWAALPVALVFGLAALLLSGIYVPWTIRHGGLFAFGEHAERLGAWLAPGVRAEHAVAIATTFVFLQGVHYATWIGWIPQDDLRTEGTPTFRMSVRAWVSDFGPLALIAIAILALGFMVTAAWDVRQSLFWYTNLAKAHGWLECAMLTYFVTVGLPRRRPIA